MFNHETTEAREINWLSQVDTNSKNHTRSTQPSSNMSLCYCTLDLLLLSLLNVLIIVQILNRNLTCCGGKKKPYKRTGAYDMRDQCSNPVLENWKCVLISSFVLSDVFFWISDALVSVVLIVNGAPFTSVLSSITLTFCEWKLILHRSFFNVNTNLSILPTEGLW